MQTSALRDQRESVEIEGIWKDVRKACEGGGEGGGDGVKKHFGERGGEVA